MQMWRLWSIRALLSNQTVVASLILCTLDYFLINRQSLCCAWLTWGSDLPAWPAPLPAPLQSHPNSGQRQTVIIGACLQGGGEVSQSETLEIGANYNVCAEGHQSRVVNGKCWSNRLRVHRHVINEHGCCKSPMMELQPVGYTLQVTAFLTAWNVHSDLYLFCTKEAMFHAFACLSVSRVTQKLLDVFQWQWQDCGGVMTWKHHCFFLTAASRGLLWATGGPLTTHTVMFESAEPVTILSSLRLPWRPHTLSWWPSSVFTHSLVFMVHSFTKPSEPLRTEHSGAGVGERGFVGRLTFISDVTGRQTWPISSETEEGGATIVCASHPH